MEGIKVLNGKTVYPGDKVWHIEIKKESTVKNIQDSRYVRLSSTAIFFPQYIVKADLEESLNLVMVEEEKKLAQEIMQKLGISSCVLCGGAPRNWMYNRPANDFDIYVSYNGRIPLKEVVSQNLEVINDKIIEINCYEEVDNIEEIFGVIELEYKRKKVQVISFGHFKTKEDLYNAVIDSFDFNICKIGMFANGCSTYGPDFAQDFRNKTLTIDMECMYDQPSSMPKRFEKMQKYFPDHKIVLE